MLRRRVALTVAVLTVAALLAALMPWSGSGAADKPKDTTAGTLEEVHQPTAVLLPSSGTVAEYVPNAAEVEALAKLIYGEENVGRVLPAEYCFFTGDGRRNHFTTEWKSTDCFGWTLESPYTD